VAQFVPNKEVVVNSSDPPIQWSVFDPAGPNGTSLTLKLMQGYGNYNKSFQTSGGYIIMGGLAPQTTAAPNQTWIWELAYYTSFDGTYLSGIQPVPNPPNPDIAGSGGAGAILTSQGVLYIHTGPLSNTSATHFCAVFPISVGLTSTTGYFTPKPRQGQTQNIPEYVSLGEPDYDDIESTHKVEWIRYDHVDTSKNMLLCDDLANLQNTCNLVRLMPINPQPPPNASALLVRDGLQMRGQKATDIFGYSRTSGTPQLHETSEDVTPVFRVVTFPGIGFVPPLQPNQQPTGVPGHAAPGWGDSVTLETANASVRKRFDISWSRDDHVSFGESPGQDFSQRQIPLGAEENRDQYLRLLKFPSGELPRLQRPAKARAGGDIEGSPVVGRLDELRVSPFQSDRFVVWDQSAMGLNSGQATFNSGSPKIDGITETANEIPIANTRWYLNALANLPGGATTGTGNSPFVVILPDGRGIEYDAELTGLPNNDAGLVQIDDEIIAFRRIGRGAQGAPAILDCERGVFNTTAQKHGYGANVIFLDFLPATMLSQAITPSSSLLDIASEQGFATTGGLVMIDRELIHYTEIRGRSFAMPPILNEQGEETGGLFRGRFGTTTARHDNEALVIEMPFRYWDRWAESQDNPEISFYEFAVNRPGAWFEKFGYEERRPTSNVQLVALVRTQQDVPWCTDPTRASPKLMRFEGGLAEDKSLLPIGRHGTALEARFYVRWLGNSFDPITLTEHDWKTTPELRWAEVHYFDETQVLSRESSK
jgi:hypothetical protein